MSDDANPPDARVRAARYAVDRFVPDGEEIVDRGTPSMEQQAAIVETSIQQAIRRGEFDNLPGAGKPLPDLGGAHDPDWWIRRKIERERLTGLGPPALTLRTENAELDARLDRMMREEEVRATLEDFNRRVVEARRQLLGGPPVVTPTRDVEAEVAAWRRRRETRPRPVAQTEPQSTARRRFRRRTASD